MLRTQVGSGLHGVTVQGHDESDEMGVCIEPPEYVVGLKLRIQLLGVEHKRSWV